MSLDYCRGCGRKYASTILFQSKCPDCLRTEAQTEQLASIASQQAAAVADAQHRMAASEEYKNQALADAAARQAEAAEREAIARARAATAAAVGQMSDEGLARVHQYHLQEEDRANIQKLFDEVGNCIALVEQDGRDTPHFREAAYEGEVSGSRPPTKDPFAYRWHNLGAGIAKLLDLKTEAARIRTWNAAQSREDLLRTIDTTLEKARVLQRNAAYRFIRAQRESRASKIKRMGIGVGAALTMGGIAAGGIDPSELYFWGPLILVGIVFAGLIAMASDESTILSHAEIVEMASGSGTETLPPKNDPRALGIAAGALVVGVVAVILGIKAGSGQ